MCHFNRMLVNESMGRTNRNCFIVMECYRVEGVANWLINMETITMEQKKNQIPNAATGDQPTYDDLLGFSPYVEAIKEFLINPSTKPPLTLSIEGSWGSGKSSFMLQLIKELEANGECTVLFNAWRHDKEDANVGCFCP